MVVYLFVLLVLLAFLLFHSFPKRTGFWTTVFRAILSFDSEASLRKDPLSLRMLPNIFRSAVLSPTFRSLIRKCSNLYGFIAHRTNFMDEVCEEGIGKGKAAQVVILGAGFDSRALRFGEVLRERGVKVFELDKREFSEWKRRKIGEICKEDGVGFPEYLKLIPVDFNKEKLGDVLNEKNGFDGKKRSLFLMEGVSPYIGSSAMEDTLNFVACSPKGSLFAWDYVCDELRTNPKKFDLGRVTLWLTSIVSEPFKFFVDPKNIDEYVSKRGFKVVKHIPNAGKHYQNIKWFIDYKPMEFIGMVLLEVT